MNEIVLKVKEQPSVGLEAEGICPDVFAGKTGPEIGQLTVYEGNIERRLKDFFEVGGDAGESAAKTRIIIDGDVTKTKRIGQLMTDGELIVRGSVGMHLGSKMKGGRIVVEGNVGSFAAQEMRGGEVLIQGNAGNYLGSATRGNWRGMRGGKIVVEGNVGSETATFMRGGVIEVKGDAGQFTGVHMKKGLIIVSGTMARRGGAEMIGGTIVAGGVEAVLPGFKLEGTMENPEIEDTQFKGTYTKYSGDHAEQNSKGVLLVKK